MKDPKIRKQIRGLLGMVRADRELLMRVDKSFAGMTVMRISDAREDLALLIPRRNGGA